MPPIHRRQRWHPHSVDVSGKCLVPFVETEFCGAEAALILHTERLDLAPVSWGDRDLLIEWHADPAMGGKLKHGVLRAEQAEALLGDYIAGWQKLGFGLWIIRERASGEAIGMGGLWVHDGPHGIAIRGMARPQFQAQGYMPEAMRAVIAFGFERCGLERIVAISRADNRPGRRSAEKIGFHFEREFQNEDGVRLALYAIEPPATVR